MTGQPRVLILSASLGAGHDGAANELARRLRERGATVDVHDYLTALHGFARLLVQDGYETQIKVLPSSYDWLYKILETQRWALDVGRFIIRDAKHDVRRWLEPGWDAVVSTYPLASQTLGALRRSGELTAPVMTFLTDPSVHSYWVSPDVDLHVAVLPQTAGDAAHLCPSVPAVAAGPLVSPRHDGPLSPAERAAVRAELGLAADDQVALLVAGSWGVGDVERTVDEVLAGGVCRPLVACGRNEGLRRKLAAREGVVALGWRTDMHRVMGASDVLIQNAGGLSCLEALCSGLPVVSHSCIPGHGYTNAQALADAGLAPWSRGGDLAEVLRGVLRPLDAGRLRARAEVNLQGEVADLVSALAATGDVDGALAIAAGSWSPPACRPDAEAQARAEHRLRVTVGPRRTPAVPVVPAASPLPRRRRAGRAAVGIAAAAAAVSVLGTAGVATATAGGYGWSEPGSASVVVRADGGLGSRTLAEVRSDSASIAVSGRMARQEPAVVAALAASGVPLVNAGWGGRTPRFAASQRDLVTSREELREAGGRPVAFLAGRRVNALDFTVAYAEREHVLVPAAVEPATGPVALPTKPGVVVVDVDGLSDGAAAARVAEVAAALRRDHLSLRPLTSNWPAPPRT